MAKTEHSFLGEDNLNIVYYKHLPEKEPKALIIITHGMAEHAQRYDHFAGVLNRNDFAVYAHDQRGHGKTAGSLENVGFLSERDGWRKITKDLAELVEISKKDFPNKPLILLGHSMGSFVTRTYLIDHSDRISAAILSGTTGSAGLLGKVGILLTGLIMIFKKKNSPSKLMNQMSFGDFNKSFKPALTNFDWLSRDAGVVDKYVNDPFCGGVFSVGFFKDMMIGLELVNKPENAKKLRKDLPLYLFSGDKDPVSKNGKQVNDVFEMYKNTGMKNVKMKLYPEARHETLNEINKEEVYNDVLGYLNSLN
jgi:alpha-beta hydrolase superfamily lysophospholipase